MKTIETINNGKWELTRDQFNVCSIIATKVSDLKDADPKERNYIYNVLHGIKWAAIAINVPFQVIYDIEIEKNIKGYKNMNRLTEVTYF